MSHETHNRSDYDITSTSNTSNKSKSNHKCKSNNHKSNNNTSNAIQAPNDKALKILTAASTGDIAYLRQIPNETIRSTRCNSGCTALHWAAGSNQISTIQYLLDSNDNPNSPPAFQSVNISATKKASGRTPLHYACRNGHMETVQLLLETYGANVHARAKHGVTPFQLAVWQNRFDICRYLVDCHGVVVANDVNDFDCGAVHWIGISPHSRANDHDDDPDDDDSGKGLLPLAQWLATQPNLSYHSLQRQNHTALHKAAWGGHAALVRYLCSPPHNLLDDRRDDAGNYAADLADMANTDRHRRVACMLRKEFGGERVWSCRVLGLRVEDAGEKRLVRDAFLRRVRELHPDAIRRRNLCLGTEGEEDGYDGNDENEKEEQEETVDFDALKKAYEHLTIHDGIGTQRNPSHSIQLMLELQKQSNGENNDDNVVDSEIDTATIVATNTNDNHNIHSTNNDTHTHNDHEPLQPSTTHDTTNHQSLFKARLTAVLLEYGDKGLDLCNIPKKWKQVWPDIPFYHDQDIRNYPSTNHHYPKLQSQTLPVPPPPQRQRQKKKKKGMLLDYIQKNAGGVVTIVRRPSQRTHVGTNGDSTIHTVPTSIVVFSKHVTRDHVVAAASGSASMSCTSTASSVTNVPS